MPLTDIFREYRLRGTVIDKYKLTDGNLGYVVEEEGSRQRYSVEFKTDKAKPSLENLYGIINEPFRGKREYLEHLIQQNDRIDMVVSYSRSPIRTAYALRSVTKPCRAEPVAEHRTLPYHGGRTY